MIVEHLQVRDLRNLHAVDIEFSAGLNVLIGENGSGKTSLVEALHLLSHGRSFRGRVRDGMVRTGAQRLMVFARWREASDRLRYAGLEHAGHSWQGKLDGQPVQQLGELCAAVAVLTFEPGSHLVWQGAGEQRRRLLDWGLFHVEPDFMPVWRRYGRALRQRNALLKQGANEPQLHAWDAELADAGVRLDALRRAYAARLEEPLAHWMTALAPEFGWAALEYHSGWKRDMLSLGDALLSQHTRDRMSGHTSVGPHRADLKLRLAEREGSETFSRGQGKLAALALLLAQAEDVAICHGRWPMLLMDDLASELDPVRRLRVLQSLLGSGAQVLVTATDIAALDLQAINQPCKLFHVERGEIREAG